MGLFFNKKQNKIFNNMKTIKSLKDITTLEVGDKVIFGDLEYTVRQIPSLTHPHSHYYLYVSNVPNNQIFKNLHIDIQNFINKLGIICNYDLTYVSAGAFPEFRSLEALTVIVGALFKEYEKQNELPKTWEEFCERVPIKKGECFLISSLSEIHITEVAGKFRDAIIDRNYYTSKQEAEAFLALKQLRQLRKAYVKDWEPDWKSSSDKYCINFYDGETRIDKWTLVSHVLSFPNHALAKQFLTNFKDLIEIAKPLL